MDTSTSKGVVMEASQGRLSIPGWTHIYSGKVRDLYVPSDATSHSGADQMLVVASDRISAYDYVLPSLIPGKGKFLTQLTLWWFEQLEDVVDTHLISTYVPDEVKGRAMITRRLRMFPIECVVRGYITGSAMTEYKETGEICGIQLPDGLVEADRLETPIFTPAAKAEVGEHDENISFEQVAQRVGMREAMELRATSLRIYERAHEFARERGIVLADTKFEFGMSPDAGDGEIILADEVLTPDSSRFWYVNDYEPGKVQPSLDKQFVRDWLTSPESGWDRKSETPPPPLPDDVVERTRDRYIEAYEIITGRTWVD